MDGDPRSHGLWERTAPPPPPTGALIGHQDVDVVVIGGGYTGLSAALHLAAKGTRVVVLEGKEVGFGGSGRNVGLVNAGLWVLPDEVPRVLGSLYGDRLLAALGEGPRLVFDLVARHGMACEATPAGTLHCAVGKAGSRQLEQRAEQWQRRGAPVELLDASATAARVGSTAYTGALLDRRAGTIQPLAYVRGLAHAAIGAGATLYTVSPVVSAERERSRWRVSTPQGSVTADWVVLATNAYTRVPWPEVRAELVHLPYFNLATVPLPGRARDEILPGREGAWDTREVLTSFRFDAAGRLIFGSVGALRGTGIAVHRAWAQRAIRRLFPQIAEVAFESEWFGMIGMTSDSLPRLHRLAPNVMSFSGYNGRGIAPGTVFGRALAQHILGEIGEAELPLPVSPPEAAPIRRVKEVYYELGAQVAHLADSMI